MTDTEMVKLLAPHYTHTITVGRAIEPDKSIGDKTLDNYVYLYCYDCESDIADFEGTTK